MKPNEVVRRSQFWTFVGKKKNKKWLVYAYCAEKKEIVAWVWANEIQKQPNNFKTN